MNHTIRVAAVWLAMISVVRAQQPAPQPTEAPKPEAPAQTSAPQAPPAAVTPGTAGGFVLNLQNASLTEVIDILARRLKISYILDPRIKGSVTLNTYGELREVDIRALLDLILRMNAAAMVQVGELYRIVPLAEAARQPLAPQVDRKDFPQNDQMSLNLVFLKYATVGELAKLLDKFLGEGATMITYEPANLLLLLDNNRNMRRTMDLIALFDSDVLAGQRVRLLEVKNGRPTDIATELETILKSISLGEKGAVKFLPIDRINTLIAVAPNPGVFDKVEEWLKKLDVPVQITAGSVENHVYRVKYGRAETLSFAIMQLYMGMFGFGAYGGGLGYGGYSPYVNPAYGGVYSGHGYGMPGAAYPGPVYGAVPGYGAYPGGYGYPGPSGPVRRPAAPGATGQTGAAQAGAPGTAQPPAATSFDLSGSYLGYGAGYGYGPATEGMPRVVPNPMDNSLLIQATPQDYQQILKLLRDLDVPPRQVLIEAKIYEVTLTGAFSSGVQAYLQKRGGSGPNAPSLATNLLQGSTSSKGASLSIGTLVGNTRELLVFLTTQEDNRRAKVVSAPSLIATDSIPATLNVGQEVPVLTSTAVTGAQIGGTSLFANTVQNRNTGVTLQIQAQVNPSGIVTLIINQEVSSPVAPSADAAIQSPSFSKRTVQTQVTVQDGDTIAIGGIIQETETNSSAGVPVLHRIPLLGAAFGAKSISKDRTELIIFMTPRVIYDTNQMIDASEELKSKLRRLTKIVGE